MVFVLSGFFSLLTGVSPAYAGEDGLTWAVTQASGDVRHRTGGFFSTEWQKLRVGDTVGGAAEIRTGRNSRVVLRHRKTTITATAESRLELPGGTAFGGAYRILQSLGTLLYTIKERADGMAVFEVETPYLVAVVKGTVFTVNASAEEASVQLSEGVVRVQPTRGGKGTTLAAGQTARVTRASGADVIIGGRGTDKRSSIRPQAPPRPAMGNTQRTGPTAGGGKAITGSRKNPGTARASTGTATLAKKVRVLAGRQVAALSAATQGNFGGLSGGDASAGDSGAGRAGGGSGGSGGSADDTRDGDRVAGERADRGGPGGDTPGGDGQRDGGTGASSANTGNPGSGTGDGGQAPGASPEGGNPGGGAGGGGTDVGGGAGGGTNVGGSVGGGDAGGGHVARSDWSQDTARGANAGRGKKGRGKTATGSTTTMWSAPWIDMEIAGGWIADIWEGITEGMDTWVGAVWLLAVWAVLWVAVSMLKITLTKTKKRPSQSGATMAGRRVRQPV
ncbi:MAG: FecR domain-containing protein [Rhodospirillales bacterium]